MFTSDDISPDLEKIAALKTAGPPQSMAEDRFFLFFAGANADSGKVDAGDITNEAGPSQEGRRVSVDTTMSNNLRES